MYNFWATTLLGERSYKNNTKLKHIQLNQKKTIGAKYFERWLVLWEKTVNEYFEGEKANLAIHRANQIGELMQYKIS